MKLFHCFNCNQVLYFENNRCERCGSELGFLAATLDLYPLKKISDKSYNLIGFQNDDDFTYCMNHEYNVCNWMLPAGDNEKYCEACQLNQIIPHLDSPDYKRRWSNIENAKHRLVYSILRLGLPLLSKKKDPANGLSFNFLADGSTGEQNRILTGHSNGLITLNIAEADDVEREQARKAMDEVYRTVLGHFRHEIGHYYWDRLVNGSGLLEPFRELFGDEREPYASSLEKHYLQGAPPKWQEQYISAYATAHPWEDWAETWAHYMHIIDTLETAHAFNVSVQAEYPSIAADKKIEPYEQKDFALIINEWLPFTFAMNSINRGMGLNDLYPFIITPRVIQKLHFIHQLVYTTGHDLETNQDAGLRKFHYVGTSSSQHFVD